MAPVLPGTYRPGSVEAMVSARLAGREDPLVLRGLETKALRPPPSLTDGVNKDYSQSHHSSSAYWKKRRAEKILFSSSPFKADKEGTKPSAGALGHLPPVSFCGMPDLSKSAFTNALGSLPVTLQIPAHLRTFRGMGRMMYQGEDCRQGTAHRPVQP